MDSVPTAPERQHVGVVTVLAALALGAFVVFVFWVHHGASRVEQVDEPERALAAVVGRTLDLDEGVDRAPAWERRLYTALLGGRADDLAQAIGWYEELEAVSLDPTVDLHLAILEGEAGREGEPGRLARLRRRVAEWQRRDGDFPVMAGWIAAAYLGVRPHGDPGLEAELASALAPGWFLDRLTLVLAKRGGDAVLAKAAEAALAARGERLLWRLRGFALAQAAVVAVGALAALGLARRRRGDRARPGAAVFPPPWGGREGVVVLVRGGALGALLMALFFLAPTGNDALRLALAAAANLAFLPPILLARRRLLQPAGLGLREGFGLAAPGRDLGSLAGVLLAVLALGQAGQWGIDAVARALALSSHWTEWFEPDLTWGGGAVVAVTLVDVVVVTPLFEELLFRGLLFATLRRGLGAPGAVVVSAAIFAVAHGYGALGFASVFWSACLWAWAYEKTGSLWPCIASHAIDNLAASLSVLLVLRG
jgi:membrane protease YdiL (CAAX protease family)